MQSILKRFDFRRPWAAFRSARGCALVWLALSLGASTPTLAEEIEGVEFAAEVKAREVPLRLNAVGLLRYMVFIKAYVAALYLGPDVSPEQILDDVPRRLEIEYFYPIAQADFVSSTEETIRKNLSAEEFAAVETDVAKFNALYRSIEPGDRYALTYLPGIGTELALNGETLGVVPGTAFGRAVFSIWFGPAEIDASLKETLLQSR